MQSDIAAVATLLYEFYADCPLEDAAAVSDYRLALRHPVSVRRWVKPQAEFIADGDKPFAPLPLSSAFPLLEWGFNWSVATTAHQFLMLHAAVVEKNGNAMVLPALPGSGKSTLCAALCHRGWRLLSDEFGLIRPGTTAFVPFPRCIPLKNESIDVMKRFAPDAIIGPTFTKTRKGDVAHVKPPGKSAQQFDCTAQARLIVFPLYSSDTETQLLPISKARAFMKVCTNAFNYEIMGVDGFRTVADLIDNSDCHLLHYSDLEEAVALVNALV